MSVVTEQNKDGPTYPCQCCEGSGRVPIGEHFVSREMAMDACEPAMEGMSMGIEYGHCQECGGDGIARAPHIYTARRNSE